MDKYQQLANGDRYYYRLPLKVTPQGFTQDEFDFNLFKMNYVPCIHREMDRTIILPCKKTKQINWCNARNIEVNALICSTCSLKKD